MVTYSDLVHGRYVLVVLGWLGLGTMDPQVELAQVDYVKKIKPLKPFVFRLNRV